MRPEQGIHVYRAESLSVERGVYPPHLHSFYEMIYVEEGVVNVTLNNRKTTVSAGSLLFFDRLAMHDIYPKQLPYRRICVQISPDFWNTLCPDARLISLWMHSSDPARCCLQVEQKSASIAALKRILAEYEQGDSWSEAAAGYALGAFLIVLLRQFPELLRTDAGQANQSLLAAKQYIEEQCREDIRMEELAGKFYLSGGYFIQSFKRMTGTTPKRYQMLCRLAAARTLLLSTDLSVSDIAIQIGFHDANGFIRFFRKEMRLTPGQFRRRSHEEKLPK